MKGFVVFLLLFSILYYLPMRSLNLEDYQKAMIQVSVQGAVEEAKIITVHQHAIVQEVLEQVDLKKDADLSNLNLLEEVTDKDVIVVDAKEGSIKVSINSATVEELMTIPGIGASKAQKIVDYRKKHGRFQSLNDLMHVSGIKEKTFAKLKPYLSL